MASIRPEMAGGTRVALIVGGTLLLLIGIIVSRSILKHITSIEGDSLKNLSNGGNWVYIAVGTTSILIALFCKSMQRELVEALPLPEEAPPPPEVLSFKDALLRTIENEDVEGFRALFYSEAIHTLPLTEELWSGIYYFTYMYYGYVDFEEFRKNIYLKDFSHQICQLDTPYQNGKRRILQQLVETRCLRGGAEMIHKILSEKVFSVNDGEAYEEGFDRRTNEYLVIESSDVVFYLLSDVKKGELSQSEVEIIIQMGLHNYRSEIISKVLEIESSQNAVHFALSKISKLLDREVHCIARDTLHKHYLLIIEKYNELIDFYSLFFKARQHPLDDLIFKYASGEVLCNIYIELAYRYKVRKTYQLRDARKAFRKRIKDIVKDPSLARSTKMKELVSTTFQLPTVLTMLALDYVGKDIIDALELRAKEKFEEEWNPIIEEISKTLKSEGRVYHTSPTMQKFYKFFNDSFSSKERCDILKKLAPHIEAFGIEIGDALFLEVLRTEIEDARRENRLIGTRFEIYSRYISQQNMELLLDEVEKGHLSAHYHDISIKLLGYEASRMIDSIVYRFEEQEIDDELKEEYRVLQHLLQNRHMKMIPEIHELAPYRHYLEEISV